MSHVLRLPVLGRHQERSPAFVCFDWIVSDPAAVTSCELAVRKD